MGTLGRHRGAGCVTMAAVRQEPNRRATRRKAFSALPAPPCEGLAGRRPVKAFASIQCTRLGATHSPNQAAPGEDRSDVAIEAFQPYCPAKLRAHISGIPTIHIQTGRASCRERGCTYG